MRVYPTPDVDRPVDLTLFVDLTPFEARQFQGSSKVLVRYSVRRSRLAARISAVENPAGPAR